MYVHVYNIRTLQALTPPMTLYPPNAGPILPGLINTGVSNIAAMQAAAKAQGEWVGVLCVCIIYVCVMYVYYVRMICVRVVCV